MIKRSLQDQIENWLYRRKIIVLYGARQVGKTTLVKAILEKYIQNDPNNNLNQAESLYKYLNCELFSIQNKLETTNEESLRSYLGKAKLVILDEAQKIENIGLTLKIVADTYPETQIIATGSSSFDLSNKISEPLTGRAIKFMLYPLSLYELYNSYDRFKIDAMLENVLRFGTYPEIVNASEDDAKRLLESIASNYLYKDILEFENIKNSKLLFNLLQLLALQLGNEVSYHELGKSLGISSITVKRYIDLLEKCFVVFSLNAFSRNIRKEISKSVKIYFYDCGIRNTLIQNYNPLNMRNDTGALWENFCVIERLKYNQAHERFVNSYFWRTYDQKEIDYIEEHSGKLEGYEFKWGKGLKTFKPPNIFLDTYENASVKRIDRGNYQDFLL